MKARHTDLMALVDGPVRRARKFRRCTLIVPNMQMVPMHGCHDDRTQVLADLRALCAVMANSVAHMPAVYEDTFYGLLELRDDRLGRFSASFLLRYEEFSNTSPSDDPHWRAKHDVLAVRDPAMLHILDSHVTH